MIDSLQAKLPAAFDPAIYRELHPDLRSKTDADLRRHYATYGMDEGRRCHALADRDAFAALAQDVEVLEIGPFNHPLLGGPKVSYFDILDRDGLLKRAQELGKPTRGVPEQVHFVSTTGDLGIIDRTFDAVLSSHVLEHQPDLIRHLNAVERLLRPGGTYMLLVPDKRFCFDHFFSASTIADVLEAHYAKRTVHSLQSQVEHLAFTTHNNATAHWAGDHGEPSNVVERTRQVLDRYRVDPSAYVDVHAWYFTPTTFSELIGLLRELEYTAFRVSRVYPTLRDGNEFWAVLEVAPR
jgi:SAM-dependent methyltransferase